MFFYEAIPWYSWAMWAVVLIGLLVFNEITRYNKATAIAFFGVLPVLLTIFVWPHTSGAASGAQTANWFAWVKTYSALVGCWIGIGLRFSKRFQEGTAPRWWFILPPAILNLNILEAVIREIQVVGMHGFTEGMFYMGGPWNIMNAVAGMLNFATLCGWFGIVISKDKHHTLVWPDMMWFWIIAYDLWNFAYVYNCLTDRAFFSMALLLSCTIPAFTVKKGAWAQHRVHTLALYMMLMLTIPSFFVNSRFAVASSHSPAAYYTVSAIALAFNLGVFVYQMRRVIRDRRNPLVDELYADTASSRKRLEENS